MTRVVWSRFRIVPCCCMSTILLIAAIIPRKGKRTVADPECNTSVPVVIGPVLPVCFQLPEADVHAVPSQLRHHVRQPAPSVHTVQRRCQTYQHLVIPRDSVTSSPFHVTSLATFGIDSSNFCLNICVAWCTVLAQQSKHMIFPLYDSSLYSLYRQATINFVVSILFVEKLLWVWKLSPNHIRET